MPVASVVKGIIFAELIDSTGNISKSIQKDYNEYRKKIISARKEQCQIHQICLENNISSENTPDPITLESIKEKLSPYLTSEKIYGILVILLVVCISFAIISFLYMYFAKIAIVLIALIILRASIKKLTDIDIFNYFFSWLDKRSEKKSGEEEIKRQEKGNERWHQYLLEKDEKERDEKEKKRN